MSGLDVSALLGSKPKARRLNPQNAIPEFRQALDASESVEGIRDLARQLCGIIESHITDSFGDLAYPRAIEGLGVLREEMIEMEEPSAYNDLVRGLKTKLLGGALGGDRRDMWYELKKSKLGLITRTASERSSVDEKEAEMVNWPLPTVDSHAADP